MSSTRRQDIHGAAFSAATLAAPGAFAQALATATTTDGPYYPDRLPLDTDIDLLILNDGLTTAIGEITHFTGRLTAENSQGEYYLTDTVSLLRSRGEKAAVVCARDHRELLGINTLEQLAEAEAIHHALRGEG